MAEIKIPIGEKYLLSVSEAAAYFISAKSGYADLLSII